MYASIKRLMLLVILSTVPSLASAESFVRMQNYWKQDQYINVESGTITSSPAKPGWHSADWVVEPVGDGQHVRFKNRWTSAYIHVQNGAIEAGPVLPGWHSAMWVLEKAPAGDGYYRVKNRWTGAYIHSEQPTLAAGPALPGWHSAMWKLNGYKSASTGTPKPPVTYTAEAGPIWNQADAQQKCPALAKKNGAKWTGQWWTTVAGQMSVCQLQK